MQITFEWTCRQCGRDVRRMRDSSTMPPIGMEPVEPLAYANLELQCPYCGHVSGELAIGYRYRENHRPTWEQDK